MLLLTASAAGLMGMLIPLIIMVAVCIIIMVLVDKFSPDATITYIVRVVLFVVILIALLKALLPFITM